MPPLVRWMVRGPQGPQDPAQDAAHLDSEGDREKRSKAARGGQRMVQQWWARAPWTSTLGSHLQPAASLLTDAIIL